MTIKEIATELIRALKAAGVTIQLYEAYSSNSVYLKLDYGVCNSIRISDHRGKKHLHYRYNVVQGLKIYKSVRAPQGWPMYFYPPESIQALVKDILQAKKQKVEYYGGMAAYQKEMQQRLTTNASSAGFWAQSKVV